MMRPTLLLACVALVGGCSFFEADTPGDILPPTFQDARTNWEAAKPDRYEYGYQSLSDGIGYLILVERDRVTRVRLRENGNTVDLALGITVDDLFDRLAEAHLGGAYLIETDYANSRSYPGYVRIDADRDTEGDETGWTILSFRRLLPI